MLIFGFPMIKCQTFGSRNLEELAEHYDDLLHSTLCNRVNFADWHCCQEKKTLPDESKLVCKLFRCEGLPL